MTSTPSADQGGKNQHQGKITPIQLQQRNGKAYKKAMLTTLPLQVVEETECACWEEKDSSGRFKSVKSSSKFTSALSSERVTDTTQGHAKIKTSNAFTSILANMLFESFGI